MRIDKTNELFKEIHKVLEVAEIDSFIRYISRYKDDECERTKELIDFIIKSTCNVLGVSSKDVLYSRQHLKGKRVLATGIIGFMIKTYMPDFSLDRVVKELKDNTNKSNLSKYIKEVDRMFYSSNEYDYKVQRQIHAINLEIKKFRDYGTKEEN